MNELTLPETPTTNLPAIAKEAEEAWTQIEKSNLGDRMKSALRRIACGESIRGAAEAEGYRSHSDVYKYATQYGIVDVRTKRLIDGHRRVARLSGEELEQRLTTKPEKISAAQLAVIAGISTDKVLKSEEKAKDDGASYLSALEKMAERFAEGGKTLELRVSLGPTAPGATESHETIDVTPRGDQ